MVFYGFIDWYIFKIFDLAKDYILNFVLQLLMSKYT